MIEDVARAIYERYWGGRVATPWAEVSRGNVARGFWLLTAKAAITAAQPYMTAKADHLQLLVLALLEQRAGSCLVSNESLIRAGGKTLVEVPHPHSNAVELRAELAKRTGGKG